MRRLKKWDDLTTEQKIDYLGRYPRVPVNPLPEKVEVEMDDDPAPADRRFKNPLNALIYSYGADEEGLAVSLMKILTDEEDHGPPKSRRDRAVAQVRKELQDGQKCRDKLSFLHNALTLVLNSKLPDTDVRRQIKKILEDSLK